MGRPPGWAAAFGRAVMLSLGRPPVRRDLERAFWVQIARGLTSEDAAVACGVSGPVGSRWFRHAGGMPPIELAPASRRYLCFSEREDIAVLRAEGISMRQIAIRLGRSPSTVSRELRRNAATRGGTLEYRASTAQWKADLAARLPKAANSQTAGTCASMCRTSFLEFCETRTEMRWVRSRRGKAATSRGEPTAGGQPRRARRDLHRLHIDFPDDESMRISHEAIYLSLH